MARFEVEWNGLDPREHQVGEPLVLDTRFGGGGVGDGELLRKIFRLLHDNRKPQK